MKKAPNVKLLPKDKYVEAIIFAGTDAYSHAQHWIESEGKRAGDDVPPVYIGEKQLAELHSLIIVDEGREYQGLAKPLSVTEFGKAVKEAAKEYKTEYLTRTIKGRRQTNVQLTDKTDEFL